MKQQEKEQKREKKKALADFEASLPTKKKWILSWRLYLAAMATQTSASHVVSESSKEAIEMICSFQE
jgi:hypothetical protein